MSEHCWYGKKPERCDVCSKTLKHVFFDASVHGRWGLICVSCFKERGCLLGVGLGQAYDLRSLARLSDKAGYAAVKKLTRQRRL